MIISQKRNSELKQSTLHDQNLLKRSSLDIPLLPERDEDRKMAKLLTMKPTTSVNELRDRKRKQIISQSSLPTANFTRKTEAKAVKILSKPRLTLGVVKKASIESPSTSNRENTVKRLSLVGDYGNSSESD